jgi:hypothetical protein
MVYVGLDLHKRYITACALDADGRVLAEDRRLPTIDITALRAWLGDLSGPVTVVLEATLFWAWLERQLTPAGYTVVVAHPYQVKLIWQARTKTDPIDARKLAELQPDSGSEGGDRHQLHKQLGSGAAPEGDPNFPGEPEGESPHSARCSRRFHS